MTFASVAIGLLSRASQDASLTVLTAGSSIFWVGECEGRAFQGIEHVPKLPARETGGNRAYHFGLSVHSGDSQARYHGQFRGLR